MRANKSETKRRIDKAASMLAQGHSGTSVVTLMTEEEGISRRQSQRIVSKGYALLVDDLETINVDRKEMVSQLIVNLQAGIEKSLKLGHISAMVACVRTLKDLCRLDIEKSINNSRKRYI
tara:strand:+ start:129 stop:488 length:360 start_codon:yes stop_codon:yes gene_type:complete